FEHVLEGADLLDLILDAAPGVTILVTSRQRLSLHREWILDIGGLAVPAAGAAVRIADYGATELFCQSARRISSAFSASAANQAAIIEICRLVGGLPLGIELASAWVRALSCEEIAAEISQSLDLLAASDLPERQRSLRAVFLWAWQLLSPEERQALSRLAVFRGGFLRDAAAVAGLGLPLLSRLIDLALLYRYPTGRYALHEMIRQYAGEMQAGLRIDGAALRQAHASHYLALAEQAAPELQGAEQAAWLERLDQDHENLRAALGWAFGAGQAAEARGLGIRIGAALWHFWLIRGFFDEGARWLDQCLAAAADQPPPPALHMALLNGASGLARVQGDYRRASALQEESLRLARAADDRAMIAAALKHLGLICFSQGAYTAAQVHFVESLGLYRLLDDQVTIAMLLNNLGAIAAHVTQELDRASALFEESLAIHRALGYERGVANTLNNLSAIAVEQDRFERAALLLEESLALRRKLGDRSAMANSLFNLGNLASLRGEYPAAVEFSSQSLALAREIGEPRASSVALILLGDIACAQGDLKRAAQCYREGLLISRDLGFMVGTAKCIDGIADLACRSGAPAQAARLLGASAALRESSAITLLKKERDRAGRIVAAARSPLPPDAWGELWDQGRRLAAAEAIAAAFEVCDRALSADGP
ncbi:MAG TPA: tetratricopeptide repeat protein, partial [Herpetosiphonaceae bacterium]|nr:tetratricopeptide repeat protein [Herpetosiphonaceae bacterium]